MQPLFRPNTLNLLACFALFAAAFQGVPASAGDYQLSAVFQGQDSSQVLETWNLKALSHTFQASSSEKDPETGKKVRWHGPLLNSLIEHALKQIPLEKRAQVDLVILKGANGAEAIIPRSFVTKFPVVLATSANHKALGDRGPVYSVVPWTSKSSAVKQEHLPVESYFVPGLQTIELTNAESRFSFAFLKRRTDPIAMRGEKNFVQSCVACHSMSQKPSLADLASEAKARGLASSTHPHVKAGEIPQLDDRERRAIQTYLDAYRAENPPNPTSGPSAK